MTDKAIRAAEKCPKCAGRRYKTKVKWKDVRRNPELLPRFVKDTIYGTLCPTCNGSGKEGGEGDEV